MNRRNLLIAIPSLAILAGCASGGSPAVTPAQVLNNINGAENVAKAIVAAVQLQAPNAISPADMATITTAENALTAATSSLSGVNFSSVSPTTLQQIDAYLNDIFTVVGAVLPVVPALAVYIPMYDAAVVLITDVIEPYINGLIIPPKASALSPLKTIKTRPTTAQAQATLGV